MRTGARLVQAAKPLMFSFQTTTTNDVGYIFFLFVLVCRLKDANAIESQIFINYRN